MTKHPWKPHGLALFLFLVKAGSAAPAPSHYKVTGATSYYNGVYEERREPELYYILLGGGDGSRPSVSSDGNYYFLYKGSQHGDTWILGWGKTLSTAKAAFRAPAVEGRPPADQWSWVCCESRELREGKEEGDPWPDMRVVGVEMEMETNNCFAPQPILKSISLAILVLTVINILC